ncbi:MAG TPA: DUF1552 domain-containing protein [Planctomycetota bacterium]|nr:DUF1552 domain-containing protein [Planctomycetota bacterium]
MNKPSISRRDLLRAGGVVMGLPFLESFGRFAGAQESGGIFGGGSGGKSPVRMAMLYMPNGANMKKWLPEGKGGLLTQLPPTLEPLTKLKSEVLVLSQLWNKSADTGDGHYVKGAGWLSCTTIEKSDSAVNSNGISMDQLAAQKIGHVTLLPSLELGIEPVHSFVDKNVGYTVSYASYISWSSPTQPTPREINPKQAFNRLFKPSGKGTPAFADDKSVLDAVLADSKSLRARVSLADQRKIDEFLESVRSVETRVENEERLAHKGQSSLREGKRAMIEEVGARASQAPDSGRNNNRGDLTERVKLMLDILVLAFATDSTRIATFMFGNEVTGQNFSFIPGVTGGFHDISHHGNNPDKLEMYAKINTWHVAQYAYLLEKLKAVKEGSKTLLDNCMIVFGSGIADGNQHNPHNPPLLLAGRGGGTIVPGRHVEYNKDYPLSSLYVAMLSRMGLKVPAFADSKGELTGLA